MYIKTTCAAYNPEHTFDDLKECFTGDISEGDTILRSHFRAILSTKVVSRKRQKVSSEPSYSALTTMSHFRAIFSTKVVGRKGQKKKSVTAGL